MWAPLQGFFLGTKVGRGIATALAAAAIFLAAMWQMRRGIRKNVELENEVDRLRGAAEADRRMDHADIGTGASDDDNRDWLYERGTGKRKPRS